MAAFLVTIVRQITDQKAFARYGDQVAGLSAKFGGELLVRGAVTEILEGEGSCSELAVVVRFESAERARQMIASREYVDAKAHRRGAARIDMRLVETR